jgi:hypothetical protein
MIQAKNFPQFETLINAARNSAEATVNVAQRLIDGGLTRTQDYAYLRCQQERAAEVEKQIEILARMAEFFAQVSA